jgi:hypothetical protein
VVTTPLTIIFTLLLVSNSSRVVVQSLTGFCGNYSVVVTGSSWLLVVVLLLLLLLLLEVPVVEFNQFLRVQIVFIFGD